MVAGVGFEPHDLRVMSPTSYQAAPSRDNVRKNLSRKTPSFSESYVSIYDIWGKVKHFCEKIEILRREIPQKVVDIRPEV